MKMVLFKYDITILCLLFNAEQLLGYADIANPFQTIEGKCPDINIAADYLLADAMLRDGWSWIDYKHLDSDKLNQMTREYVHPRVYVDVRCDSEEVCRPEVFTLMYTKRVQGKMFLFVDHSYYMIVVHPFNETAHFRLKVLFHSIDYRNRVSGLKNSTKYNMKNESFDQRIVYIYDQVIILWGCDEIYGNLTNQSLFVYTFHENPIQRLFGIQKEVDQFIESAGLSEMFLSDHRRAYKRFNILGHIIAIVMSALIVLKYLMFWFVVN